MRRSLVVVGLAGVVAAAGAGEAGAAVAGTTRESVSSSGAQADNYSGHAAISGNGRFIAFMSAADNLVPGDTNGVRDAFVRDRVTGSTELVSVSSTGQQADSGVSGRAETGISSDGRFVTFVTAASNLVPGDTNGTGDVFVRDRTSGTTERASVSSRGVQGNGRSGAIGTASISATGRYVAFVSDASNLVPGDTNRAEDIFVRDRQTGTTRRVSVSSTGRQGNHDSYAPSISGDGRYVAFSSAASNLVAGDTNNAQDVFVRDMTAGSTRRMSVSSSGEQADAICQGPAISADGRYVVFDTNATNLVAGGSTGINVVVRDRRAGTTGLVSATPDGQQGNADSYTPSISAHGRYIAFASDATNLNPGNTDVATDVFRRDQITGQVSIVNASETGQQGNADSYTPTISSDGRFVAFSSDDDTLVPADTNQATDVFLRDTGSPAGQVK